MPPLRRVGAVDAAGDRVVVGRERSCSILGGIPWNCYFQRVLSCRSPRDAARHSVFAGLLTIVLTVPPLLLGLVGVRLPVAAAICGAARRAAGRRACRCCSATSRRRSIGLLGLAAIIGAVTSSFSSSILSAGSMFSWNTCTRLLRPTLSFRAHEAGDPRTIAAIGLGAVWLALEVQSVQALWFFTSDLVFVLLFPQLVSALFDRKANLAGSVAAFGVSLVAARRRRRAAVRASRR